MKIFKNIYRLTVVSMLMAVTSCEFGDANIDTANPQDVTMPLLLPAAEARIAYFLAGDAARYCGVFTQHFGGGGRQHLLIARYGLSDSDVNTAWNQQYAGSLQDIGVIIEKSREEGLESPHFRGVAKVLTANLIGVMTDLYGNIPYSEAIKGADNLTPVYDSRDQIYTTIHTLLDEARGEMAAESTLSPGAEDLIYRGDLNNWIAASHVLDARYYLHRGEYERALTSLENGFTSSGQDMVFNFGTAPTETNPLFQFDEQRTGDLFMGEYFIEKLKSLNDPRLPFFAVPTNLEAVREDDAEPIFVGLTAGESATTESTVTDLDGKWETAYTMRNSPTIFTSYTEQLFIEAEAAFQTGDTDRAAKAYNAGIAASLLSVTGRPNPLYLARNATKGADITLELIMEQKYLALYTQVETWNDLRRTGFPAIEPVASANNQLGAGLMPQRWPYPLNEQLFNADNWKANVTANTPIDELKVALDW